VDDVRSAAAHGVVDEQAHVEGHVGIAIKRGIVEGAERGHTILTARNLTVEHVEESSEENNQRAGEEMADGEHGRGREINDQAEKREEVRVHACRSERSDNFVQQPFTSCADAACKRSHAYLTIRRDESGTISIDCAFGVQESYTSGAVGRKRATLVSEDSM
jgi:hypothetical protein